MNSVAGRKMIVLYGTTRVPQRLMTQDRLQNSRSSTTLRWQSQAVLLAFLPVTAIWVIFQVQMRWMGGDPVLRHTALISLAFTVMVALLRAATPGAALTGGLFTAALYLQTPGLHTALWPLLTLFLLTFAATRIGRRRKELLGTAESKRGRNASQVAANLGAAVLAGIPLSAVHVFSPTTLDAHAALLAMVAAMAEATADTLSSELGQVLGGEPRLITNFHRVPVGTDGAVTFAGTIAGCAGAAVVAIVGAVALRFSFRDALLALAAGIAGLFFDSLLGAIPERRGWLNNDAVNTLSTVAAALLGAYCARWF